MNSRNRKKMIGEEKRRIMGRYQHICQEGEALMNQVQQMIKVAETNVHMIMNETSKSKFMRKHGTVNQFLDKCWREISSANDCLNSKDADGSSSSEDLSDIDAASVSTCMTHSSRPASRSALESTKLSATPESPFYCSFETICNDVAPVSEAKSESDGASRTSTSASVNLLLFDETVIQCERLCPAQADDRSCRSRSRSSSKVAKDCADKNSESSFNEESNAEYDVCSNKDVVTDTVPSSDQASEVADERVATDDVDPVENATDAEIVDGQHETAANASDARALSPSSVLQSKMSRSPFEFDRESWSSTLLSGGVKTFEQPAIAAAADTKTTCGFSLDGSDGSQRQVSKTSSDNSPSVARVYDPRLSPHVQSFSPRNVPVSPTCVNATSSAVLVPNTVFSPTAQPKQVVKESDASKVCAFRSFSPQDATRRETSSPLSVTSTSSSFGASGATGPGRASPSVDRVVVPRWNLCRSEVIEGTILAVETPERFWLQIDSAELPLGHLMNLVRCSCEKSKETVGADLSCGMFCCALAMLDDAWSRVQIKSISYDDNNLPELAEVFYIDFGNTEVLPVERIKKMNRSIAKLPALAVQCSLKQADPKNPVEWSPWCVKTFKELVYGSFVQAIIVGFTEDSSAIVNLSKKNIDLYQKTEKHPFQVTDYLTKNEPADLLDYEEEVYMSDEDVAEPKMQEELNDARGATQGSSRSTDFRITQAPSATSVTDKRGRRFLLEAKIPTTKYEEMKSVQLRVCYAEHPTSFYGQVVSDDSYRKFNRMKNDLNAIYNDSNVACPPAEFICVNSYWATKSPEDNAWCRVRILQFCKKLTTAVFVQNIDFGNRDIISTADLRPLCDSVCDLPAFGLHCGLADVYPLDKTSDQLSKGGNPDGWHWALAATEKFLELIQYNERYTADIISAMADSVNDGEQFFQVHLTADRDDGASHTLNEELVMAKAAASSVSGTLSRQSRSLSSEQMLNNWNPCVDDYYSESNVYSCNGNGPGVSTISRNKTKAKVAVVGGGEVIDLPCVNSSVVVFITSIFNPGHFYVVFPFGTNDIADLCQSSTLNHYVNGLESFMAELNIAYNRNVQENYPSILFGEGEIAVARASTDRMWVRIRILRIDVENDKALVFHLDYGTEEWTTLSSVCPMKPEFVKFPFQAVECFLCNVAPVRSGGDWSSASRTWFEEAVDQKALAATIKSIDGTALYIDLYDETTDPNVSFNDKLVDMNFAAWVPSTPAEKNKSRAYAPG